jgi:soluble lytic murein transglycosylase
MRFHLRVRSAVLMALTLSVPGMSRAQVATTESVAAVAATVADAQEAAFQSAHLAFRTEDDDRLRAQLPALKGSPLQLYGDYWLAALRLRANITDDAAVQSFLGQNPGTVLADRLRGEWLLALGKRGDFSRFREQHKLWVSNGNDAQIACYDTLARYVQTAPAARAELTLEARQLVAGSPDPGSDACTSLADRLLDDNAMPLLFRLQALVERNQLTLAERVAQRLGNAWVVQFKKALAHPDAWLKKHAPRGVRVDASERQLAFLSLIVLAHDDPERAAGHAQVWEPVLSEPEKSAAWARIARSAQHHLLPQAHDWFQRVDAAWAVNPDSVHLVDGLEARIRADLRRGSTRAAAEAGVSPSPDWADLHLTFSLLPASTQSQENWQYWNAQALISTGQPDAAQQVLQGLARHFSYYGRLSAEQLKLPTELPDAPQATDARLADELSLRPGMVRARLLLDAGLRDDGRREWAWELRGLDDTALRGAAAVAQRFSMLDRAIYASERTHTVIDVAQRYPTPYVDLLGTICAPLGIETAWVYGLIRQESRFMHDVRSSVGAVGLMQIMPATAKYVAKRIGLGSFNRSQMADVPVNLRLGSEYLRMVYDDQDSRTLLASAAYNAGPNRVRRWRAALARPLDGALFVETIPIDETRDYVQKVLFNTAVYAAVMKRPGGALMTALAPVSPKDPPEHSDLP